MELLGRKIKHKIFQTGTVVEFDGNYLTVEFSTKTSKFQYPDVFANFITAEDAAIQAAILEELAQAEAAKAEAKLSEEEKRKEAEQKRLEEIAQKAGRKVAGVTKSEKRPTRIEGKRMTFYVFQGNTFDAEYRGGYIWAPKYNAAGNTCHHWGRLLDVREGDIILHGTDGYIEAISVVKGSCYDAESPTALKEEQLWANDGRRVDCDYTKINHPIKTADYKDTIINYCSVKYAPFDKNGNGNMGYLFEINQELASFFVEASTKKNGYLLDLGYVQELLVKYE